MTRVDDWGGAVVVVSWADDSLTNSSTTRATSAKTAANQSRDERIVSKLGVAWSNRVKRRAIKQSSGVLAAEAVQAPKIERVPRFFRPPSHGSLAAGDLRSDSAGLDRDAPLHAGLGGSGKTEVIGRRGVGQFWTAKPQYCKTPQPAPSRSPSLRHLTLLIGFQRRNSRFIVANNIDLRNN